MTVSDIILDLLLIFSMAGIAWILKTVKITRRDGYITKADDDFREKVKEYE